MSQPLRHLVRRAPTLAQLHTSLHIVFARSDAPLHSLHLREGVWQQRRKRTHHIGPVPCGSIAASGCGMCMTLVPVNMDVDRRGCIELHVHEKVQFDRLQPTAADGYVAEQHGARCSRPASPTAR